ncbi:MAG: hypothetical protein IKK52_04440 [Alphaproteobacteria bacterium]|nr:hypothetical protein [Alphaproteobacteria bacterium]
MLLLKRIMKKIKSKKIEYFVEGKNNKFICLCNGHEYEITKKSDKFIKVLGNNNVCFFETEKIIKKLPKGVSFSINGNNNCIKIKSPNFSSSEIYIRGDNNKFKLGKTIKTIDGGHFFIESGGEVCIGDQCELGNSMLWCVVNGDAKGEHHKLVIGDGTHVAKDAIIRTSDGECLIDKDGKPLSKPQDIIIGKHCWITSRCIILKGTVLPEGSIVAANSLVNKKFTEKNCLIAGCPAVIKKKDVYWIGDTYGNVYEKFLEDKKQLKED